MRIVSIVTMWSLCGVILTARAIGANPNETAFRHDSITSSPLYFRMGSAVIDPTYRENAASLRELYTILTDSTIVNHLDSVRITVTSSPEGGSSYNKSLALRRAETMRNYIEADLPMITHAKLYTRENVAHWQEIRRELTAESTPYQPQIRAILDQHLPAADTEAQLKRIDNGKAWAQIARNSLPKFRSAITCIVYTKRQENPTQPQPLPRVEPTTAVETKPEPEPPHAIEEPTYILPVLLVEAIDPQPRRPLFALKTNLLYDALTAWNIEIEVPIRQRWSVAGEFIFPWWLSDRKQRCFQSRSGYLEARYWFGDRTNRRALTGWFMGVYGGGGCYDVEWSGKGYQGEFFIPFALSGGYAHTIGRNLSMEYSIGVGYMQTNYREYNSHVCSDGMQRLMKQRSGTYRWFGPTRVKVSLVWMINTKTRSR